MIGPVYFLQFKEEKIIEKEKVSATKIQRLWRQYSDPFVKGIKYIDQPEKLKNLPRAQNGKTKVYLPKELPIVLKHSGSPHNKYRLEQMKQAWSICVKSGYSHLVIPNARIHGQFIIERKLPFSFTGTKEQIGLYIENKDSFTAAVKEFMGFFCQANLSDILHENDVYTHLISPSILAGRYDNIPLYLEGDQGKIGLIDLETFHPRKTGLNLAQCLHNCQNAILLFPFHVNEILEIAANFCPEISTKKAELEGLAEKTHYFFEKMYHHHLDFLQAKKITFEHPTTLPPITSEQKEEIKNSLLLQLETDFDGSYKDKILEIIQENFITILESITNSLTSCLEEKKPINESVDSNTKLLSLRTIIFEDEPYCKDDWYVKLQVDLYKKIAQRVDFDDWETPFNHAKHIIKIIFENLQKTDAIAFFGASEKMKISDITRNLGVIFL